MDRDTEKQIRELCEEHMRWERELMVAKLLRLIYGSKDRRTPVPEVFIRAFEE